MAESTPTKAGDASSKSSYSKAKRKPPDVAAVHQAFTDAIRELKEPLGEGLPEFLGEKLQALGTVLKLFGQDVYKYGLYIQWGPSLRPSASVRLESRYLEERFLTQTFGMLDKNHFADTNELRVHFGGAPIKVIRRALTDFAATKDRELRMPKAGAKLRMRDQLPGEDGGEESEGGEERGPVTPRAAIREKPAWASGGSKKRPAPSSPPAEIDGSEEAPQKQQKRKKTRHGEPEGGVERTQDESLPNGKGHDRSDEKKSEKKEKKEKKEKHEKKHRKEQRHKRRRKESWQASSSDEGEDIFADVYAEGNGDEEEPLPAAEKESAAPAPTSSASKKAAAAPPPPKQSPPQKQSTSRRQEREEAGKEEALRDESAAAAPAAAKKTVSLSSAPPPPKQSTTRQQEREEADESAAAAPAAAKKPAALSLAAPSRPSRAKAAPPPPKAASVPAAGSKAAEAQRMVRPARDTDDESPNEEPIAATAKQAEKPAAIPPGRNGAGAQKGLRNSEDLADTDGEEDSQQKTGKAAAPGRPAGEAQKSGTKKGQPLLDTEDEAEESNPTQAGKLAASTAPAGAGPKQGDALVDTEDEAEETTQAKTDKSAAPAAALSALGPKRGAGQLDTEDEPEDSSTAAAKDTLAPAKRPATASHRNDARQDGAVARQRALQEARLQEERNELLAKEEEEQRRRQLHANKAKRMAEEKKNAAAQKSSDAETKPTLRAGEAAPLKTSGDSTAGRKPAAKPAVATSAPLPLPQVPDVAAKRAAAATKPPPPTPAPSAPSDTSSPAEESPPSKDEGPSSDGDEDGAPFKPPPFLSLGLKKRSGESASVSDASAAAAKPSVSIVKQEPLSPKPPVPRPPPSSYAIKTPSLPPKPAGAAAPGAAVPGVILPVLGPGSALGASRPVIPAGKKALKSTKK